MDSKRSQVVAFVVVAAVLAASWYWGGSSFGQKVESANIEVYYKDGATKAEADRLLAHFVRIWPPSLERRSIQLVKPDGGYRLRMAVKAEFREDEAFAEALAFEGARASRDVFGGAPVEVEACDGQLATIRAIPPRPDLRHGIVAGKVEVFFPDGVETAEAQRLGQYLVKWVEASPNPVIPFKLIKRDGVREVHATFTAQALSDPTFARSADVDRRALARDVFDNAPVEFHLCDEHFRVQKVVK